MTESWWAQHIFNASNQSNRATKNDASLFCSVQWWKQENAQPSLIPNGMSLWEKAEKKIKRAAVLKGIIVRISLQSSPNVSFCWNKASHIIEQLWSKSPKVHKGMSTNNHRGSGSDEVTLSQQSVGSSTDYHVTSFFLHLEKTGCFSSYGPAAAVFLNINAGTFPNTDRTHQHLVWKPSKSIWEGFAEDKSLILPRPNTETRV